MAQASLRVVETASGHYRQEGRLTRQRARVSAHEFGSHREAQRGDTACPRSGTCLGFEATAGSDIGRTLQHCTVLFLHSEGGRGLRPEGQKPPRRTSRGSRFRVAILRIPGDVERVRDAFIHNVVPRLANPYCAFRSSSHAASSRKPPW